MIPPNLMIGPLHPPMQASKWLIVPVLIDAEEMSELFKALPTFYIYMTSCPVEKGKTGITQEAFLESYRSYISQLQNNILPDEGEYRAIFSSVLTINSDCLYATEVNAQQYLARILKPVIQLQPHRLHLSPIDGSLRSKSFGPDCISWGIQFSYPQLFQDPIQNDIQSVEESDSFPNTVLFHKIQYWIRHHTVPTPFLIEGRKINSPVRIGKKCFSWINQHPQLLEKGLRIAT